MRRLFVSLACLAAMAWPELAHSSTCHAFVRDLPGARYAQLGSLAQSTAPEVTISFVGHSTYRIETAEDVVILTDYFGANGQGRLPDVVTMNIAHETHYTSFPDPNIPHVLRGWNPTGPEPADHLLELRDAVIRNVTTDIRGWGEPREDWNSIFIIEVAGLCIGHLGHLHHELTEAHYAQIGRLDIVMAPVDGSFTLAIDAMVRVLKRLKARLVLPMHAFGPFSMQRFLDGMSTEFAIRQSESRTIRVSRESLPAQASVMVVATPLTGFGDD